MLISKTGCQTISASVKSEQETETVKTENNGEYRPMKKFTTYHNFLVSHETENGIGLTIYGDMKGRVLNVKNSVKR